MLYKASDLKKHSVSSSTKEGVYIPCRPEGMNTIPSAWRRFKVALGVMFGKYDAVDWEEHRYGMPTVTTKRCNVPPEGWTCSREAGHDGPCAAYPVVYARIEIPVDGDPHIVGEKHQRDLSTKAVQDLINTGVEYIHEYYWPGDNYYAFVRFAQGSETERKLSELGTLTHIDQHYMHHDREVRSYFDEKYPTTQPS